VLDDIDPARVRRVRDAVLARGGGWTTPEENLQLLSGVAIAAPRAQVVKTVDDALAAAGSVGYPVAIKALGPSLLHKTERRAVRLGLENETALRAAFIDFTQRFGSDMTSVLVQQMVPAGVEMLVGVVQDPLFGPLIACGTGGTMVDVLQDTQFRLHPLTTTDAAGMLNRLKGIRLLRGFRGSTPADVGALRDVLLRVSTLLTLAPEIQELDLNPVIVLASGAWAADVRIRIASSSVERSGRRVEY
jgi:acyl-CoA synthetase (NDP forming)